MSLFGGLFGGNKELGLFLGGVLMGTAGIRVLTSDDARKVYVQGTAAALRGKEEVMTTATTLGRTARIYTRRLLKSTRRELRRKRRK